MRAGMERTTCCVLCRAPLSEDDKQFSGHVSDGERQILAGWHRRCWRIVDPRWKESAEPCWRGFFHESLGIEPTPGAVEEVTDPCGYRWEGLPPWGDLPPSRFCCSRPKGHDGLHASMSENYFMGSGYAMQEKPADE